MARAGVLGASGWLQAGRQRACRRYIRYPPAPHVRDRTAQSPNPRLRALLPALEGWERVLEEGRYLFADPVTGERRTLAEIS